ncbi:MAG: hypothetical protein J6C13_01230, partial [Clostridia bacterium]|nr:hypothetical protein [Clostridia bacterium]
MVSSIWFANAGVINESLKYKYDEKGNITEILENGVLIVRYAYDSLSRLIREDNIKLNKTTTWQYDAGGNIINRFEYDYTQSKCLINKGYVKVPYTYSQTGIKDQLVSYNGQAFAYDLIGNPTTYKNQTLVWEKGRQLKSFGNLASYEYNANGIRTKKVVSNTTTQYFLDGTRILAQKDIIAVDGTTTTETLMQFIYGVDGIAGFILNGENYYYKKNLQGDIIGIFDNNRQIIAKYDYDSWGNFKIYALIDGIFVDLQEESTYTTNNNVYVALKNPFRYR